jgi:hypothetical protein
VIYSLQVSIFGMTNTKGVFVENNQGMWKAGE